MHGSCLIGSPIIRNTVIPSQFALTWNDSFFLYEDVCLKNSSDNKYKVTVAFLKKYDKMDFDVENRRYFLKKCEGFERLGFAEPVRKPFLMCIQL